MPYSSTVRHIDLPNAPLYPFGYGLSYTTFTYGEPTLRALLKDGSEVEVGEQPLKCADVVRLTASVEVRNDGECDGREVVQWYVTDPWCSIARPVRELKHFEKRMIGAGETQRFLFEIDPLTDLGFVDGRGHRFLEPGLFTLQVGGRSVDFTLE